MLRAIAVLFLIAGTAFADPWWRDSSASPPYDSEQQAKDGERHSYDLKAVFSPIVSFGSWILDWSHDDWLAFGTFIIAAFTAVLGGGTIYLVRDGRRHSERTLRAYVTLETGCVFLNRIFINESELQLHLVIKNSGLTPAHDFIWWFSFEPKNTGEIPFNENGIFASNSILGPNATASGSVAGKTTEEELRAIASGEMTIYVWGRAEYFDIFRKERRWLIFRCSMNGSAHEMRGPDGSVRQGWAITPDPSGYEAN